MSTLGFSLGQGKGQGMGEKMATGFSLFFCTFDDIDISTCVFLYEIPFHVSLNQEAKASPYCIL